MLMSARFIPPFMKTLLFRGAVRSFQCAILGAALLSLSSQWLCAAEDLSAPEQSPKEIASKVKARYEKVLAKVQSNRPPVGSVICIGSSQMEFWKTVSEDLAPLSVFNHGVAGSRMSHAEEWFVPNLVVPFKPRAVILYEGSNDLAGDLSPEKVLEHFRGLHRKLHESLPETRLYVLGLVPSPGKRFDKIDEVRKVNALLKEECDRATWMRFIDTTTPLLGADGTPREECFIPKNIHLNAVGYSVWKSAIAPVMLPLEQKFEMQK